MHIWFKRVGVFLGIKYTQKDLVRFKVRHYPPQCTFVEYMKKKVNSHLPETVVTVIISSMIT